MIRILKSSLAFFTTLPVSEDLEKLQKNLWSIPLVGLLIGLILACIVFFLNFLGWVLLKVTTTLAYISIEGINHIDGLADFGDALFAPKSRKKMALKDSNIGAGGTSLIVIYLILITYSFIYIKPVYIIISQILAKYSMLILILYSNPSWDGLASMLMKWRKRMDLPLGSIILVPILIYEPKTIILIVISLSITVLLKTYSERQFGGISGDILGAVNCMVFASSLIASLALQ